MHNIILYKNSYPINWSITEPYVTFDWIDDDKKSDDQSNIKEKSEKKRGELYGSRLALSSTNLIKDIVNEEEKIKTPGPYLKQYSGTIQIKQLDLNGGSWGNNNKMQINQDDEVEDDCDFYFKEETLSSESNSNNIEQMESFNNKINNNSLKLTSSSIVPERAKGRQKTVNSSKMLFQNFDIFENNGTKKEKTISFFPSLSVDNRRTNTFKNYKDDNSIYPYINYFDEPDEYYLKNAKKELMMNVFSLYFFDSFFYSDNFKNLKNYYFQKFEGVQSPTKKLDFPSKIKNYNNGLEPNLFLKPFTLFCSLPAVSCSAGKCSLNLFCKVTRSASSSPQGPSLSAARSGSVSGSFSAVCTTGTGASAVTAGLSS